MNHIKAIKRAKSEAKKTRAIAMSDIVREYPSFHLFTESEILLSLEYDWVYLPVFN